MNGRSKSQTSIYIILGIILIIIVFFSIALIMSNNKLNNETSIKHLTSDNVDDIVELCLFETLEEGLLEIGFNGGYYSNGNIDKVETLVGDTRYWVKDGKTTYVSNEFVEGQLRLYIYDNIETCIKEITKSYVVNYKGVDPKVNVYDDYVKVEALLNSVFTKGDIEKKPGIVSVTKKVNLGLMLKEAKSFIEDISDGEEELLTDRNFVLMEFYQDENTSIYSLFDNDIVIDDINYQLMFVVDKFKAKNYPPRLIKKDIIYAKVGQKVVVDYDTEDDYPDYQLMYSSSSMQIPPININTGVIEFTPEEAGEYTALITVMDGFRQTDMDTLIIEVEG